MYIKERTEGAHSQRIEIKDCCVFIVGVERLVLHLLIVIVEKRKGARKKGAIVC